MIIVVTTTPTINEAEALAEKVVEARLAACVQILPRMTSIYFWDGKMMKEGEHLLLIKSLPEKFDELGKFITANHSYDVPEIVAVDAERVSEPYLSWIKETLRVK